MNRMGYHLRAIAGIPADPTRGVPCPWCRAAEGMPCTTKGRGRRTTGSHPARRTAWDATQQQGAGS